ncbi:NADPH-dependent 7-cyano-7-deazaguanine reductase QueF [Candidatus Vallotia cooleyia]|uniref:NADPH-dependent 7-cyano-7-deazaguanine reductase QueF n=1 Tax=Candidatus Vallotiella adelgis TaxID=1177211 RepID=UPI001D02CB11|nr:NADPH-dependent 7-cyano-7-deazaguanine reductase QueF [Candidatus Vallotia cooleyia]UDG82513.1 NADPH-dependent 7-cyano-7-deazaguanine reductase [Candidatus Vallotia cooleyia]
MTSNQFILGKKVGYSQSYNRKLLFPIERRHSRNAIGIPVILPFFGTDIWNAYELSWLNKRGKPQIALATFHIPAESPNIIESKSFKLYLGSFAKTRIASIDVLRETIHRDVCASVNANVSVQIIPPDEFVTPVINQRARTSLDRLDLDTDIYMPDPSLLSVNSCQAPINETVFSDLLKSNCPVTGQPDWGSIQIQYVGPPIDHASLLRYIVSYRDHTAFHEQCVEHIFIDIQRVCKPIKLAVYARYTRRGGLDINPFRTNFHLPFPDNTRTVRQ